jgi:hypothetical protein
MSQGAQADLLSVYAAMIQHLPEARPITSALGSQVLVPGVYVCMSYCSLNGTLTFDALGDPLSTFQILTEGYLMVSPAAEMRLVNGAQPSHIYWTLGAYAALGPASSSSGIIVAQSYVALVGAVLHGSASSLHAAASLVNSSVDLPRSALTSSGPGFSSPIALGRAASFAILASSAISNTVW